ncbi:MAG: MBL fold metallo-hydrolase [Solirubrobacterales bacterium]
MSIEVIDTRFMGIERAIACHRVGDVLVDPGPASSIDHVIDALGDVVPSTVLLTHVHLDHAGGTGKLAEHFPELQVYIHADGLPHIVDPSRLLASAERTYGEDVAKFGETIGVPAERVHPLGDGDVVAGFEAIHTPGHSGHHMAFFHLETEYVVVGDLAGQTIHGETIMLASTPPPEVDIELWIASIDKLATRAPSPSTLGLAHFGRVPDALDQLDAAKQELRRVAELARESSAEEFLADLEAKLEAVTPDVAESMVTALPPLAQIYAGLARYWSKRADAVPGGESA